MVISMIFNANPLILGFSPGIPPSASLPNIRPAASARLNPQLEPGAAVCLHPTAAGPSQHSGAVEWQEEEEPSSSWNYRSGPWICC